MMEILEQAPPFPLMRDFLDKNFKETAGHSWMKTVKEATRSLETAHVPRPRWTAEQLLSRRLGCEPIDLYLDESRCRLIAGSDSGEAPPSAGHPWIKTIEEAILFQAEVAARANGVPLQYLLGSTDFYGREFLVGPGVFIPRPETEMLIDVALGCADYHSGAGFSGRSSDPASPTSLIVSPRSPVRQSSLADGNHARSGLRLPSNPQPSGSPHVEEPVVVDVGTGCGAIAITLALECRGLRILATDFSDSALSFARRNARRHGCDVSFVQGDLLSCFQGGFVDLIVANPPYLDPKSDSTWPRELHWEPRMALDGREDGLALIRKLIQQATRILRPGGKLVLEIGAGQAPCVRSFAGRWGLTFEQVVPDLAGLDRVVVLWKS